MSYRLVICHSLMCFAIIHYRYGTTFQFYLQLKQQNKVRYFLLPVPIFICYIYCATNIQVIGSDLRMEDTLKDLIHYEGISSYSTNTNNVGNKQWSTK